MDLNDLKSTVSNLTLYDIKAGFRKAQNGTLAPKACLSVDMAMANLTCSCNELHRDGVQGSFAARRLRSVVVANPTKVREATNNEPWGSSSTLNQEIANATFN